MKIYKPAVVALVLLFLLTACNVSVKKNGAGEDKNVDVKTPFADIHVDKGADARDTGLPVYAGARPKQNANNDDDKNANVDISGFGFGVKVVAVSYESDDNASKIVAFYKNELKRYGSVLECHTQGRSYSYDKGHESKDLKCQGDSNGKTIELKAGNRDNQHIVAIDPKDKGADFSLVYVRIQGKEDTI